MKEGRQLIGLRFDTVFYLQIFDRAGGAETETQLGVSGFHPGFFCYGGERKDHAPGGVWGYALPGKF